MANFLGRWGAVLIFGWIGMEYLRPLRGGVTLPTGIMCTVVAIYSFLLALGLIVPRHRPEVEAPLAYRLVATVCFLLPLLMYVPIVAPTVPVTVTPAGTWISAAGALGGIACLPFLGRSFSIVPGRRRIVSTGPYRFVRHPLYLCNALILTGYVLVWYSAWSLGVAAASLASLLLLAALEERTLRVGGPEYEEYCRRVPYRYFPGIA